MPNYIFHKTKMNIVLTVFKLSAYISHKKEQTTTHQALGCLIHNFNKIFFIKTFRGESRPITALLKFLQPGQRIDHQKYFSRSPKSLYMSSYQMTEIKVISAAYTSFFSCFLTDIHYKCKIQQCA